MRANTTSSLTDEERDELRLLDDAGRREYAGCGWCQDDAEVDVSRFAAEGGGSSLYTDRFRRCCDIFACAQDQRKRKEREMTAPATN